MKDVVDTLTWDELWKQKKVRRYMQFELVAYLFIAFCLVFGFGGLYNHQTEKHINSLMSYCEKTTNKRQASFDSEGMFIGCGSEDQK